jgi:hypothetical protein
MARLDPAIGINIMALIDGPVEPGHDEKKHRTTTMRQPGPTVSRAILSLGRDRLRRVLFRFKVQKRASIVARHDLHEL